MVVSERQQDPPKLNFARPWAKLNFRLLIRSCCNASFLHHAQVTTKHSISNWISWSNFAHPFYLNLHGAFGLLLVLGGWERERFIKHHLPIPCSRLRLEVFKRFFKKKKFLEWHSHSLKSVCILTKAFCTLFGGAQGRRKTKAHLSQIFYKVKDRTQRVSKSYNHDREVHVYGYVVDGVESERIRCSMILSLPSYFGHG